MTLRLLEALVLRISDLVLSRSMITYGMLMTGPMLMDIIQIPLNRSAYCFPELREHLMCQLLLSGKIKLILWNQHIF